MSQSVYVINQIVGTSAVSWEDAAKQAVETAAKTLDDIRIAEVVTQDVALEDSRTTHYSKVKEYRIKLNISCKYHPEK